MRVRGGSPSSLVWLARRAHCVLTPNARAIETVDEYGQRRGVVALDNVTFTSAEAHMAVDAPIAWRTLLPAAFRWAFVQSGLRVLLGLIPSSNMRSCRFVHSVGFTETHRVRDGWAEGVDLVLFELRREHCRWLTGQQKVA